MVELFNLEMCKERETWEHCACTLEHGLTKTLKSSIRIQMAPNIAIETHRWTDCLAYAADGSTGTDNCPAPFFFRGLVCRSRLIPCAC